MTTSAPSVLIIAGSPKRGGNTDTLAAWFAAGARSAGAQVETVRAAGISLAAAGCMSCRACQQRTPYGCVLNDDASAILQRMAAADAIVFATPLYFFSMSAQLKVILDRMFSLYKWDNAAGTMETVLRGRHLVLLASAFEDQGLKELEAPLRITAAYTGMPFDSLLVPNAGESGGIAACAGVQEQAHALGARIAVDCAAHRRKA